MPKYARLPTLVAALLVGALASVSAQKAIDLDSATIADLNAAFDAGSLTAERLVQMCLARIQAYDRQGPAIRAVIAINPKALETARLLDAERKSKGPRSPLHGIPVVLSRDDIIPLALSFDTGGPMARSVYDVAAALGVMTGVDAADAATRKSEGRFETDYTKYLTRDGLKGARIGIARDFLGADTDVDWVVEASLDAMRRAGATVVDVRFPKWLLNVKGEFYNATRYPEFAAQIAEYLSTLGPSYPKNIDQLIERATLVNALRADGAGPNPARWGVMRREAGSGTLDDYRYTSVRDHALPMVRAVVEGILTSQKLDAIVYPTSPRRPALIVALPDVAGGGPGSAVNLANLTGFPDLIVPAGFTGDDLPVGLSFLGPAFSEPKLLALGYSFEQATRARRLPVHTPKLPRETITIP
jgi:amidase